MFDVQVLSERPELNAGPDGNPTNYHPMEDNGMSTPSTNSQLFNATYHDFVFNLIRTFYG